METPVLDENHTYHVGHRTPPGVNQVLDLYFTPCDYYTEEGRILGTARHQWFHALAQGLDLENEPDPRIAGAVGGFRKFMAEVRPGYMSGEVSYYDDALDVCGTPDLVCMISGRTSVVDYKPESRNKRTPLQLAAYRHMLLINGMPVMDRYELRLLDRDYRLDKCRDADDEKRWPIMVAAFHAATHYR